MSNFSIGYIKSCINDRTFQVKILTSYSEVKTSENGLPQDSILSPILFSIAINDLPDCVNAHATL